MHKGYLLLRNNKQSGPFSQEELIQQTLMPYDLIWVEGRSAGWQYPSEIDSLKTFVQPSIQNKAEESTSPSFEETVIVQTSTASTKTGKHIYVSMPAGSKSRISTPVQDITDTPVIEQRKDAFEKKAEELYKRAQAFQQNIPVNDNKDTAIETKYNKSLDDLKQEYSSWMHAQKSKTGYRGKKLGMAAAVILVMAFAVMAGVYFFRNESSPALMAEDKEIAENNLTALPKKDDVVRSDNTTVSKKSIPLKKTSARSVRKPSLPSAKKKIIQPAVINKKEEVNAPLPQLVSIKGRYKPVGKGVSASEITVKNNSHETLRVVAVDVVYYTVEGSIAGRKTIYFNDLLPSESKTLSAPSNQKAEGVRYKLGLISSKEGGIYYAMQ